MAARVWKSAAGRSGLALTATVAVAASAQPASAARHVRTPAQFQAAVKAYRATGGTIVMFRGTYARPLVVGPRSWRRLTIRGLAGARIHSLRLDNAQSVTVRALTVRPVGRDGGILALRSRSIVLADLRFTAAGTRHRVSLDLQRSIGVTVENSQFSHCGDRSRSSAVCLYPRLASHVTVRGNRFHHCRGCDAIHGLAGRNLVIEENRFAHALACRAPRTKCHHQDPIELFLADGLVIRRNVFDGTGHGRGQIFLSQATDDVRIVNNVFLPGDRHLPGVTPWRGVVVGSRLSHDVPLDVRIINNTILSGDDVRRPDVASIVISPFYATVEARRRPLLVNNVFAWLPATRVCARIRGSQRNLVMRGGGCSSGDRVGDPQLTAEGRPTAESVLLVDQASAALAPLKDILGHARVGRADIGAYEFVP